MPIGLPQLCQCGITFAMEIRHLRYFVAAVEQGSLQGAAQRLNVAQPALSRRIRDLEATLGCELFQRSSKGIVPTRAGYAFYADAHAMLETLNRSAQRARRLGLQQDREVRFGIAHGTPRKYAFVGEAMGLFTAANPEVGVAFSRASSYTLVGELDEGALDMALLYERRADTGRLGERLIHQEHYVLAVHPANPLAGSGPVELSDLVGRPFVWLSRTDLPDNLNPLLLQLRRHGLEPTIGHLAESPEEQLDVAVASAGMCLTPASTMLAVTDGQLCYRPLPWLGTKLDLALAWGSDAASAAAHALLATVHAAIDRHQAGIASGEAGWAKLAGYALVEVPD